jgi:putative SOS response-associated peptidase YedK
MCGRSSLTKTEKEIEVRFDATFYTDELERYNPIPNFNIAPTHYTPVVTLDNRSHLQLYRWGLIPSWAKDKSIGSKMINARVETLDEKPAFKRLVNSQRCIIALDGFYEWKREGNTKVPYRIVTVDQSIFGVAGVWDSWRDGQTGELIHSYTVITMPANHMMSIIHDRMPAILLKQNESTWLDQDVSAKDAMSVLIQYPDEAMEAYTVSDKVNSVRSNDSSLIEKIERGPTFIQGTLFD